MKLLRDKDGIAINEKIISLVLANANHHDEIVEDLGSWAAGGLKTPITPKIAPRSQKTHLFKSYETQVLFYSIQNINLLI